MADAAMEDGRDIAAAWFGNCDVTRTSRFGSD
jgi:hypothetical protein